MPRMQENVAFLGVHHVKLGCEVKLTRLFMLGLLTADTCFLVEKWLQDVLVSCGEGEPPLLLVAEEHVQAIPAAFARGKAVPDFLAHDKQELQGQISNIIV